jgi:iron-sulfur cluster insertion protein
LSKAIQLIAGQFCVLQQFGSVIDLWEGNSHNFKMINSESQDLIFLTEAAVGKVQTLIKEEDNKELKLRVYIVGGGCSGFQYGFTFTETTNDDDFIVNCGTVTVIVDAQSAQYLIGAVVDYVEGLQGARFEVRNPNAETTCGCGSSFTLKED